VFVSKFRWRLEGSGKVKSKYCVREWLAAVGEEALGPLLLVIPPFNCFKECQYFLLSSVPFYCKVMLWIDCGKLFV
jgi:hypothetical protein